MLLKYCDTTEKDLRYKKKADEIYGNIERLRYKYMFFLILHALQSNGLFKNANTSDFFFCPLFTNKESTSKFLLLKKIFSQKEEEYLAIFMLLKMKE